MWIKKLFEDESNNPSSVRVFGAIALCAGLVLLFIQKPTEGATALTFAGGILGAGQIKSAVIKKNPPVGASK
tara:strand:- start:295 stop:510 length:216 start_codon:yes stop_codon:yes gene_type:complete